MSRPEQQTVEPYVPTLDETMPPCSSPAAGSVSIGTVIGFGGHSANPLVAFWNKAQIVTMPARSVIDLHTDDIGHKVVLSFEDADVSRPIVIGLLRQADARKMQDRQSHVDIQADGERVVLTAKTEIVLRCGAASITLTRAGKVLISGESISTRARGVNRIMGGSVQLN